MNFRDTFVSQVFVHKHCTPRLECTHDSMTTYYYTVLARLYIISCTYACSHIVDPPACRVPGVVGCL